MLFPSMLIPPAVAGGGQQLVRDGTRPLPHACPRGRIRSVSAAVLQQSRPRSPSLPETQAQTLNRLLLQTSATDVTKAGPKFPISLNRESIVDQQLISSPSGSNSVERVLRPGHVHVFAYGANMSITTLHRRDVHKVVSRDAATVVDPSICLVFKHRGGYATLAPLQTGQVPKFRPYGEQVHGVLYQLHRDDLKKLQRKESGYQLARLQVKTYDGEVVEAYVFVSGVLCTLPEEVAPTESYMRLLRQGASDNYLDPSYQAFLSSIDTVTSAGLPPEYFNTPAKYLAYGFIAVSALVVGGFFVVHH